MDDDIRSRWCGTCFAERSSWEEPCQYCGDDKYSAEERDYHYLCFNCGFITHFEKWTLMKADLDSEELRLIPVEPGDEDPICICPVCQWHHTDDDSNPGIFDGTYEACEDYRAECWSMYHELWNDVCNEVFYGKST